MKRTGIDHPKTRRLANILGIEHFAAVGLAECLWHFTARHAIRGNIGKWENKEIAAAMWWPPDDAGRLITALVESRLVDKSPNHRLIVHDWAEHAEDSVHTTVARRLEYFADGTTPKTTRLNKDEKQRIRAEYSRMACEENTTEGALRTNKSALSALNGVQPEPLPEPLPPVLDETRRDETRRDDLLVSCSKKRVRARRTVDNPSAGEVREVCRLLFDVGEIPDFLVVPDRGRRRGDVDLLAKLGYLALTGQLAEEVIVDALRAIHSRLKAPNKAAAYFRSVIADKLFGGDKTDAKRKLNRLLAGVRLPPPSATDLTAEIGEEKS